MSKRVFLAGSATAALLLVANGAGGFGVLIAPGPPTLATVTVTISDNGRTTYNMTGSAGSLSFSSEAVYDPATGQTKETLTEYNGNKIKSTAICTADPWLTGIACAGGQVSARGDFTPDVVAMIAEMQAPVSAYLLQPGDRERIKQSHELKLAERQNLERKLRAGSIRSTGRRSAVPPTPTHSVLASAGLKKTVGVALPSIPAATPTPHFPLYGAEYTGGVPPVTLKAGQTLNVSVTVRNTSSQTWPPGGSFRLSYHWFRGSARIVRDGDRTFMPAAVAPGSTINLSAKVTAPPTAGAAALQWDMVNENVAWFSDKGVAMSAPRNVNVTP